MQELQWLFSIQEEIFHFQDKISISIQVACKERHQKVSPSKYLSYHDHGLHFGQGVCLTFRISPLVERIVDSDSRVFFVMLQEDHCSFL